MTVLQGILLGLVQGLGEFLPISSSGHLLLTRLLLGIQSDSGAMKMLDILLHVGTLIPVIIVFWKDWIEMLRHPIRNRTLLYLFIASLPALLFYVVFDMDMFDTGWFLGPSFLLTAVLLLLIDAIVRHRKRSYKNVTVKNALAMGFMQGCGLLPGISRSGSTIFGGVASGLSRKAAASFSFMMSAPAIAASLLVEGKHALDDGLFSEIALVPTICGVIVAGVVGYLAIRFMLRIITRIPMAWFSLYLAILGVAILIMQLGGSPLLPAFMPPEGMHLIKFLN